MSSPSKRDLAAYDRAQSTESYLDLYVFGGSLLGLIAGFGVQSASCDPKEPGFWCHGDGYVLVGLMLGATVGLMYARSTIR